MIFNAKNEENKSTCDLVLSGHKTVTRRPDTGKRMYQLGQPYAVQRGRGKPGEGQIMIVSVLYHSEWIHKNLEGRPARDINRVLQLEAEREGFLSWKGLLDYMAKHSIDINNTIRYRFKLLKNEEK